MGEGREGKKVGREFRQMGEGREDKEVVQRIKTNG